MDHPRTDRPRQRRFEFGLADKLARILNGPVSGKVHQASVYFDERGEREARAIAERDQTTQDQENN